MGLDVTPSGVHMLAHGVGSTVDRATLKSAVLEQHGFHPIDAFVEEEWGEWRVTVADGQTLITMSLSGVAEARVAVVSA